MHLPFQFFPLLIWGPYSLVGFWDEYTEGEANDAHEFLKKLLSVLCDDYIKQFPKVPLSELRDFSFRLNMQEVESTPVDAIFGGYIRTTGESFVMFPIKPLSSEASNIFVHPVVSCTVCKKSSHSFQHVQEICLDTHMSSVATALVAAFSAEYVENYNCVQCHKYVTAKKLTEIEKPPKVLTLQIKR